MRKDLVDAIVHVDSIKAQVHHLRREIEDFDQESMDLWGTANLVSLASEVLVEVGELRTQLEGSALVGSPSDARQEVGPDPLAGVKIKVHPAVPKDEIRMVSPAQGVPLTMRTGIIEDVWTAPSPAVRAALQESEGAGMDKVRLDSIRMLGGVAVPIDLHDRLVERARKAAQGQVARSVLTAVEHEMNEARCEVDTRVQADAALPVMERNPGHLAVFNAAYMQGMARALQAVRREVGAEMPGWSVGAEERRTVRKRRPDAGQG